jgi:hypothetical protein
MVCLLRTPTLPLQPQNLTVHKYRNVPSTMTLATARIALWPNLENFPPVLAQKLKVVIVH